MSEVMFKGVPVKLAGEFPLRGTKAPDFHLSRGDLSLLSLGDLKGRYVILSIFPSLDTSICGRSVRKFNEAASQLFGVSVLAISRDLPFAQSRFCTVEGIKHVEALSDFHLYSDFGKDYGVLMADGPLNGLFARAVIVINPQGNIVYTELVPEVTHEPDYEAALNACKAGDK